MTTNIKFTSETERAAQTYMRHLNVYSWTQEVANLDLDPYSWSHFVTALANYEQTRWEAAISFAGLSIEEQLASHYAKEVPSKYKPFSDPRSGSPVGLKDINFESLINWAESNVLLSPNLAVKAHQVRKARNFFSHAYAIMRSKMQFALNQNTIPDLIPTELGIPDYLASLLPSAPASGVGTTAPGILNSEEAAIKVIQMSVEVLTPLV